jgi:hypothetical protein
LGWTYKGVVSEPNKYNDNAIRLLTLYNIYHYKNGTWMPLNGFNIDEWLYPAMNKEPGRWIYSYNSLNPDSPSPEVVFSSHQLNAKYDVQLPERKKGIIKTATPIEKDDAANKEYVDNASEGSKTYTDEKYNKIK